MGAIDKANQDSLRPLKKIISSKGKAAGNFYAIADDKFKGGISITMSAKDPKGSKALAQGKAMRKEKSKSKYCRGLIIFDADSNKLTLQVASGNLSTPNLKKALKIGFGAEDLIRFLKKAMVTALNAADTDAAAETEEDLSGEAMTSEELAAVELTAEEEEELASEQVTMSAMNDSLSIFLSQEDDDNALMGVVGTAMNLLRRTPASEETAAERSEAIALLSGVVEFEKSESPDSISPGMRILLEEATRIDELIPNDIMGNDDHRMMIEETKAQFLERIKAVGAAHLKAEIEKYNNFPQSTETIDVTRAVADNTIYVQIRDALYARHLPNTKTIDKWAEHFLGTVETPDSIKMIEVYHPSLMADLSKKWGEVPFDFFEIHKGECGSSWEKVKAKYLRTPIIMERFTQYRKDVVDTLLSELRSDPDYKTGGKEVLLAKSVGSQNLTSDYDLTLASSDGSGIEIKAIKAFNDEIKSRYSKQPGTVFDTNLYAKDFLKVKDTILSPDTEDDDLEAVEIFTTLDAEDQDIAALTKMCQYMNASAWDNYIVSVTTKIPDAKKKAAVEKQMREASNLLTIKRLEILKGFTNATNIETADDSAMWTDIKSRLETKLAAVPEDDEHAHEAIEDALEHCGYLLQYLEQLRGLKADITPLEAQYNEFLSRQKKSEVSEKEISQAEVIRDELDGLLRANGKEIGQVTSHYSNLMVDVLSELEHLFDDEILESRNDIYMEKMTEIRTIQNKHRALSALNTDPLNNREVVKLLSESDAQKYRDLGNDVNRRKWLSKKSDSLKEQSKRMLGEANFFAAEAYLSEGPLQHIVFGNQSGNLEAMAKLKPEHFLESVNEQTGDFMKDMGHYGDSDGKAFIQTAKYLSRMFEGIVKLNGKMAAQSSTTNYEAIPTVVGWKSAAAMQADIEEKFMPIRSAAGQYANMTEAEKFEAALDFAETVYGTRSSSELASKVMSMSASLNAQVRQEITVRSNREGLQYQENSSHRNRGG